MTPMYPTPFVVGADLDGDFEVGVIFVLRDLEGFWEYFVHPAQKIVALHPRSY